MASVSGDGKSQRVVLKISSSPANVAPTRKALEFFAQGCGFDEASRGEVGLVVNEALANVIRHAYRDAHDRPIEVVAECVDEELRISIRDWGCGTDPLELPCRERDPLRPGGLGIICMRDLMDEISFFRQSDGMLLKMTRRKVRKARPGEGARGVG
jgi:anti-sigma regulatory factor (Ser/Thr protein kinase)